MKLAMYIPDKNFREILNGFLSNESKRKLRNAIKNGIALPDNATNGDVIKTMFPDLLNIGHSQGFTYYGSMRFSTDWLNAPYKRGEDNAST